MDEALKKTLGFGTKEFITRAIEGGWQLERPIQGHTFTFKYLNEYWFEVHDAHVLNRGGYSQGIFTNIHKHRTEEALLDPLAWRAVGKVEGWIDKDYPNGEMRCENKLGRCDSRYCEYGGYKNPKDFMHRFIDALVEEAGV